MKKHAEMQSGIFQIWKTDDFKWYIEHDFIN